MEDTAWRAAVIIPAHNRKAVTLKCLHTLRADGVFDWARIVVVDDGSTDGTEAAVREQFESAIVLRGNGRLWWTGAIRRGMELFDKRSLECFFWLNDDCLPAPGTMLQLLERTLEAADAIYAAQCVDPETGEKSYGGGRISGTRLVALHAEASETLLCDWLPGNLVCFPGSVIRDIGLPDHITFPHYYGDAAYTLMARRHGYRLVLAGNCRATCKQTRHDFSILAGDFTVGDLFRKYVEKRSGYYCRAHLGLHRIAFGRIAGTAVYAVNVVARHAVLLACRLLLPAKLNRWLKAAASHGRDIGEIRRLLPRCPLCGSERLALHLDQCRWKILFCRHCNNALTWPQPGRVDYTSQDFHTETSKRELVIFEDLPGPWRGAIESQLRLLRQTLATGARVLEIGCGQGIVLERLAQAGFRVCGLEASVSAAKKARARGLDVRCGEFPSDCPPGSFDAVILSHVLEHLKELDEALAKIETLAPAGLVLLVQSNWRGLIPRAYLHKWYAWMPAEHYWHFTPKGLRLVLAKRGWKVLAIERSTLVHEPRNLLANFARRIPLFGDQFHLVAGVPACNSIAARRLCPRQMAGPAHREFC